MKYALVLTAALALSGVVPAFAEKGPNGGQMEDIAGVDAELLVTGKTLTFNIFVNDENKPLATKGTQVRCLSSAVRTVKQSLWRPPATTP